MPRRFIVIGDTASHGGTVISGAPITDTAGKRIARVGDQVTCPKDHGGTTLIVTEDLNVIIDGSPAARHGDITAWGATLVVTQVPSNAVQARS